MSRESKRVVKREVIDEKTNAVLCVYDVKATTIDKATKEKKIVWEGEYSVPKSLEDAMEYDGEEKVYGWYFDERLTNFLDSKRRVAGDGKKAKLAKLLEFLEKGEIEEVVKLMKELGLKTANLKALKTIMDATEDDETAE